MIRVKQLLKCFTRNNIHSQQVVAVTCFLGIPIWEAVVLSETVPKYVKIEYEDLGSTQWKSALPQWAFNLPRYFIEKQKD